MQNWLCQSLVHILVSLECLCTSKVSMSVYDIFFQNLKMGLKMGSGSNSWTTASHMGSCRVTIPGSELPKTLTCRPLTVCGSIGTGPQGKNIFHSVFLFEVILEIFKINLSDYNSNIIKSERSCIFLKKSPDLQQSFNNLLNDWCSTNG